MHSMGSGATMASSRRQKVRVYWRRGAVSVEVALGTLSARRLMSDMVGLLLVDDLAPDPRVGPDSSRTAGVALSGSRGDFRSDWGPWTTHLGVATARMTTWLAHDLEPA